ncbi:peptidoglycan editing factor PgeF [Thiomicrorhabdus sp. ZW0627]|uniref:peptidoglycan editing factor PgeF n=1 Tax=Thiomicrorhabdus sp. ZW0627 TaxID=3039774 RepID=UPI0024373001|nr:peptidoglycan editing factor PgeF [Thiomicrorhabdus sp. ZW0627]MDG6772832.1 peptidoglycan editing factor PgeF [Thiomicrorhabdus sp. ZW0627]
MFIHPDWPAPKQIKALCTTRKGGVSKVPYDSFNLATHVGDQTDDVEQNRLLLKRLADLPSEPFWLDQQHTKTLICLDDSDVSDWEPVVADASWSSLPNHVAVVMTADCLPILVTNLQGTLVTAIHAGWKGAAEGIVTKSLLALPENPENLMVWIGPAIRQDYFEVGKDVLEAFVKLKAENEQYFQPLSKEGAEKYLADLAGLVKSEMLDLGVQHIYDSGLCSFENQEDFYSYRRDGQTGRMASLIWIAD